MPKGLKQLWKKLDAVPASAGEFGSPLPSRSSSFSPREGLTQELAPNWDQQAAVNPNMRVHSSDVGQNGNNVVSLAEIDNLVVDMVKALVGGGMCCWWQSDRYLLGQYLARLGEQQGCDSQSLREDHQEACTQSAASQRGLGRLWRMQSKAGW